MFCKYCGAQVPDGAKFCPKCGGALTSVSEAPKAEAPKPQPQPQPQPQQQAYTPEPEVDQEPKKPYMSMKDLFAGAKITVGGPTVNKRNLILLAVGLVVLVILGLCSH